MGPVDRGRDVSDDCVLLIDILGDLNARGGGYSYAKLWAAAVAGHLGPVHRHGTRIMVNRADAERFIARQIAKVPA